VPTLRPKQLKREADGVAELIGQPASMMAALVKMLTFYADRTRRAPSTMTAAGAASGFGVARPVIRALETSLTDGLAGRPEQRADVAEALWLAGYAETRALAAELLGQGAWPDAARRAETWSRDEPDLQSLRVLATRGLRVWPSQEVDARLSVLSRWLASRSVSLQRLGLLALREQVGKVEQRHLPAYFTALEGLIGGVDGGGRRLLERAVLELVERSPAETARFLLDEVRRHNHGPAYVAFLEQLRPSFPEPQKSEIARALSAS
jgi:hypothetical protein